VSSMSSENTASNASSLSQPTTIELEISGMSCGHCKSAVERALGQVAGVTGVQVDLAGGKASVLGQPLEPAALINAVIAEGYGAHLAGA
jgi:copper chaperone